MKKVLLYSGGMDSWLMSKLWNPDIKLYVDMKTKYSENEIKKIKESGEDVTIVELPIGQWERDNAIIPLRNMYLAMVACNITEDEDVEILIGATAGDRVLDKSPQFCAKANALLNYLYLPQWWLPEGKKVKINVQYKQYSKSDLLNMYVEQGGDLEEAFKATFSCYEPTKSGKECWSCKPCFRKFVAFEKVGYKFPKKVLNSVIPYINENIVPEIEAGTYGRGKTEEEDIMNVMEKYSYILEEK